jgi:hypothetical protein
VRVDFIVIKVTERTLYVSYLGFSLGPWQTIPGTTIINDNFSSSIIV